MASPGAEAVREDYAIEIERDASGTPARLVYRRLPADTVATVSVPCGRPSCGNLVPPQKSRRGERKVYCSTGCRTRHWDEQHPRVEQPLLDFTPPPQPIPPVVDQRVPAEDVVALRGHNA